MKRLPIHLSAYLLVFILAGLMGACVPASPTPAAQAATSPTEATITLSSEEIVQRGLTGRLIMLRFVDGSPALLALDLETGELTSLFHPPRGSWITAASASPVTGKIAIAYAPAPAEGQAQTGFTGISLLPLDGTGEPQELIPAVEDEKLYSFPTWSPDGAYLYYNEFQFGSQSGGLDIPVIGRQAYPQGTPETIVQLGQWPRLSTDGGQVVFVSLLYDGVYRDSLQVLELEEDGMEPVAIPVGAEIEVMDMPLFSPDGRMIYFSAADPAGVVPGTSLLERLLGVVVAQAHNVPSDWWRVPLEGGAAERLSEIGGIGLYGDFSPDGSRMAFISNSGVHVMNPDGSGLDTLIEADGFFGTIDWVP